MAKKLSGPQIVTANHLRGGDVVYLTVSGDWSVWVTDAAVADDDVQAQALLDSTAESVIEGLVVEPYLIEVQVDADTGSVAPVRYRERLRASGPSSHPHFGKQANQHASHAMHDVSIAYANGV